MSDDIRGVMPPTPFSPLKRTTRSGDHKDGSEGHHGGWSDVEDEEPQQENPEALPLEGIAREVDAGNERLRAAGKSVRLRLAGSPGAPFVEIVLPGETGGEVVARRIAPGEISQWVPRLETAEGLMIDEKM